MMQRGRMAKLSFCSKILIFVVWKNMASDVLTWGLHPGFFSYYPMFLGDLHGPHSKAMTPTGYDVNGQGAKDIVLEYYAPGSPDDFIIIGKVHVQGVVVSLEMRQKFVEIVIDDGTLAGGNPVIPCTIWRFINNGSAASSSSSVFGCSNESMMHALNSIKLGCTIQIFGKLSMYNERIKASPTNQGKSFLLSLILIRTLRLSGRDGE